MAYLNFCIENKVCASPTRVIWNIPLKWSIVGSPMSLNSSSGGYTKRIRVGVRHIFTWEPTHLKFDYLYFVCYYRWYDAVKSGVEHWNRSGIGRRSEASWTWKTRRKALPGLWSRHRDHYVRCTRTPCFNQYAWLELAPSWSPTSVRQLRAEKGVWERERAELIER